MTTDPFIEAAYTEAKRMFLDGVNRAHNMAMKEARGGFIAGARWARDRLAAQEPTDAEVRAAAWAICRLQDDGYEPTEDHPCGACAESARAALSAARAARRDEKDAP